MEVELDWGESEGEGEGEFGSELASSTSSAQMAMEGPQTRRLPRESKTGLVVVNLAGVEVLGKRGSEMGKGRTGKSPHFKSACEREDEQMP